MDGQYLFDQISECSIVLIYKMSIAVITVFNVFENRIFGVKGFLLSFGLFASEDLYIIWISNLLIMSVSYALNSIYTELTLVCKKF